MVKCPLRLSSRYRHHRKYSNSQALPFMPGLKWASISELVYLTTKLDGFASVHSIGKARTRNPKKLAYLNDTYDEFDKLFPGSIIAMDLPRVGKGGSQEDRRNAMLEVSNPY
jgi:hypothetical protein